MAVQERPETGSVTSHAAVFGNTDPERFDRLINNAWFGVPSKGRYAIEREWDKIGRQYRRRSRSECNFDVPIPWFVVRSHFDGEFVARSVLSDGAYTCISSGTVSFLDSWVSCLSDESLETLIVAQFAQFYRRTLPPKNPFAFDGKTELDRDDIVQLWGYCPSALKKEMDRLRPSIEVPTSSSIDAE